MEAQAKKSTIKSFSSASRWWFKKLFNLRPKSSFMAHAVLVSIVCSNLITGYVSAEELLTDKFNASFKESSSLPANHKTEDSSSTNKSRQGRQYDSPLSASNTGTYASVSGDSSYVGQPSSSNYASSPLTAAAANYASELSSGYHSGSYHDPLLTARGYPMPQMGSMGNFPSAGSMSPLFSSSPMSSLASASGPSGLLSSGSMFPLMGKGFDVSEIICTAIAVAIGAVIVGAPLILIYLFIMNQMNGNGASMGPSSGGAISLTGPTSSTTVNGRKKRHTSFPEALLKQLSPYVNSEQVAQSFKLLMSSIAKYQK